MATAPPIPKAPLKGKGFSAWYSGHKTEAILGAGGIVVTIALYVRSKNSSAAASGTGATATPSTSTIMPGTLAPDTGSYGNGGGDIAGLESVISGLSSQISGLQPQSGTGGSGAGASTPAAPSYQALTNPSDLAALTSTNTPLYYQPTPGVYEQVGDQPGNTTNPELAWIQQNLPGGTGLYVKGGA